MHERQQRIYTMLLEEFKEFAVPEGWKMTHISGEEKRGWPGSCDVFFQIQVVAERMPNYV